MSDRHTYTPEELDAIGRGELLPIEDVKRLRLEPGEMLVIQTDIDHEIAQALVEHFAGTPLSGRALIVPRDAQLRIVRVEGEQLVVRYDFD